MSPASPAAAAGEIDWRLVHRFGIQLMSGGYTALPTFAYQYYARLDVTEAELVFITQLCTYWWSTRDPYPGEEAIAARMGKTKRTIQGYIRSLEGKGLLHIHTRLSATGQRTTNAYDLRPFFCAIEGLARLDGAIDPEERGQTPPAGRSTVDHGDRCGHHEYRVSTAGGAEPLCAGDTAAVAGGEEVAQGGAKKSAPQVNPVELDIVDFDSMPPTPRTAPARSPAEGERSRLPVTPDEHALAAEIATISVELGDDALASSIRRACNLWHAAGDSLEHFLQLVDEAATRTRARQDSIVKRRRDGHATNGMPYLFAVLQDLLHPAPQHSDAHAPERGRRERPGRPRRRPREEQPHIAGIGWTDSPARLPITENNQVWRAVLDELALVLTVENFNTWLAATRVVGQDGEVLRIAVPTAFNKRWLEEKLQGRVRSTFERVGYGSWQVEYVVETATVAVTADEVMVS